MTKTNAAYISESYAKTSTSSTPFSWQQQRSRQALNAKSKISHMEGASKSSPPQKSRSSIKKVYVRFDDYLDLNEENMRRSCKKIMNKLYTSKANPSHITNATTEAVSAASNACLSADVKECRPKSPPPIHQIGKSFDSIDQSIHSTNEDGNGVHSKSQFTSKSSTNSSLTSSLKFSTISPHLEEKSYLRSQYERRQKRQLEMMNKMQHKESNHRNDSQIIVDPNSSNSNQRKFDQDDNGRSQDENDVGASNNMHPLEHQQDLVAKSHELSKRRFFEKLERRESMKKSLELLSTQDGLIVEQIRRQSNTTDIGIEDAKFKNESKRQIFQDLVKHPNRNHGSSEKAMGKMDSHLMLNVGNHALSSSQQLISESRNNAVKAEAFALDDTHGGSTRPPANSRPPLVATSIAESTVASCLSSCVEETAVDELIEFHTHLPIGQLQKVPFDKVREVAENNYSHETSCVSGNQAALIELARTQRYQRPASDKDGYELHSSISGLVDPSMLDQTAFEIKVPTSLSLSSGDVQIDEEMSNGICSNSGSLTVRLVEVCRQEINDNDQRHLDCRESNSVSLTSIGRDTIRDDPAKAIVVVSDSNKVPLNEASASTIPTDNKMAETSLHCADQMKFENKEEAASSISKKSADNSNNNDVICQIQRTIVLQRSDNQSSSQSLNQEEEKVICATISNSQVNQNASEHQYHDADMMKKATPISLIADIETEFAIVHKTTSKSASDKNNSLELSPDEMRAVSCCPSTENRLQLVKKVACKSEDHECPEIKTAPSSGVSVAHTSSTTNSEVDHENSGNCNEGFASTKPELHDGFASQIERQHQLYDKSTLSCRMKCIDDEVVDSDLNEAVRGTHINADIVNVDANDEAVSLETIITNERPARDVPPEANGAMLNERTESRIGEMTTVLAPLASSSSSSLPPLDNLMGDDAALKNSPNVNNREQRPIQQRTTPKLMENKDGGKFGDDQQMRHSSKKLEPLVEHSLLGQHHEQALKNHEQQYANPMLENSSSQSEIKLPTVENCISDGNKPNQYGQVISNIKPQIDCENMQLHMNAFKQSSIEPLCSSKLAGSVIRIQKSPYTERRSSVEEDIRSSCSSSGFGASVCATSSSSSSESHSSSTSPQHHSFREKKTVDMIRRSLNSPPAMNSDRIYNVVKPIANNQSQRNLTVDDTSNTSRNGTYEKLVGPDQAYPDKRRRPLVIENLGYASLVDHCQVELYDRPVTNDNYQSSVFLIDGHYANLPIGGMHHKTNSIVEYATVKGPLQENQRNMDLCIPPTENKRYSLPPLGNHNDSSGPSETDCDSNSNSHNLSISSTESGGFSKLPPARLIDRALEDNSASSNARKDSHLQEIDGQNEQNCKKSASFLKRFGSLVSRAFNSNGINSDDITPQVQSCKKIVNLPTALVEPKSLTLARNGSEKFEGVIYDDRRLTGKSSRAENSYNNGLSRSNENLMHIRSGSSTKLAEADLVILPAKNSQKSSVGRIPHQQNQEQNAVNGKKVQQSGYRFAPLLTKEIQNQTKQNPSYRRSKARRLTGRASICSSESSSYSESSLEFLSLKPDQSTFNKSTNKHENISHLRRTNSLSDELESIKSYNEPGIVTKQCKRPGSDADIVNTRNKFSIDCVSTTEPEYNRTKTIISNNEANNERPRLLQRWFGHSTATQASVNSNAISANNTKDSAKMHKYESYEKAIKSKRDKGIEDSEKGFISLIDRIKTKSDCKLNRSNCQFADCKHDNTKEPTSLIYSMIHRSPKVSRPGHSKQNEEDKYFLGGDIVSTRCQSLNIYQSLMRNYVERHHHRRHGRGDVGRGRHRHHHHHHHHHHETVSSHKQQCCTSLELPRHAHLNRKRCSRRYPTSHTMRSCVSSDSLSCESGKVAHGQGQTSKSSVWGQLIRINKSDGTQVVELQRAPSKSWGFFVARGAINNEKGIFISRMHDDIISSSLNGLLSIGDRIISIDNCTLGPDFDILRVNQMISKKSKIVLKVRLYKG